MSKKKATVLLSIISIVVATILLLTFIQFPVGVKDNYVGAIGGIQLDYDLEGGVAYTLTLSSDNEHEVEDTDEVVKTLQKRIEALGYGMYVIKVLESSDPAVKDKDIRIELENKATVDQDMQAILAHGDLVFAGGESSDSTSEILKDIKAIESAEYLGYSETNNYGISITFTNEGKEALFEAMKNVSEGTPYYFKVSCGGESHHGHTHEKTLLNLQIQKEYFSGNSIMVSNISSKEEACRLTLLLENGGIEYDYHYESQTITSLFGSDVAVKCLVSIVTLIAVLLILYIVIYKGLGVITALSTVIFMIAEAWLMIGVPGITLSFGGVIGMVCATIICALSMFSFAQRVKEEYESSKKTVKAAIAKGFRQSLIPTINLHVVVGVVCLALLVFANGLVKNFAITFGIGVAVSLLCTLLFTRIYTALVLPLVKNKEKFLRFNRAQVAYVTEEEATEE